VPHCSLKLSLGLKPRLVLKAIIAGQAAHQLATPPIIENAAEILARDPSHSGKIALSNLLVATNTPAPRYIVFMGAPLILAPNVSQSPWRLII
jgi:hypothetical protein